MRFPRRPRPLAAGWPAGLGVLAVLLGAQAAAETPQDRSRASMMPIQATGPVAGEPSAAGVRILAPGVVLAAPASEARFPIELTPEEAVPRISFVRIRGLPPVVALSDGHVIAPGAWAVPIGALARLSLTVPAGTSGKSELTISLVTIDGVVVAETRSALLIAPAGLIAPREASPMTPEPAATPPSQAAPAAPPAPVPLVVPPPPAPAPPPAAASLPPPVGTPPSATPPPVAAPAPPPVPSPAAPAPSAAVPRPAELAPAARQRAESYMARGETLLREGNIVAARLFFERAADEGLAEGALAMGGTYDAIELAKLRVQGLQPDRDAARRWYERARRLGSAEAAARLVEFGRR